MKARDVMVSPVITIGANDTVLDAAKLLVAKDISAVPVVDHAGKLIGIISEADLMHRQEVGTGRPASWWLSLISGDEALASEYVQSHAIKVKDAMTREVQTAHPDTPLCEIADILEEKHIKRVPIVDDKGDLVGVVSRANIIQAFSAISRKHEISAPDATIRESLVAELKKQPWAHVHKLNVTVVNGVVELWGLAQSERERQGIRVAAEGIPGVIAVHDHLLLEPALF